MNNVIVNNKPRPVVPAPLVIGRTQSVFSFGGFSLWRDETLDKEIKSAQERHANEIERYKEKAKAWDELTAMTYTVFLDTNAVLEEYKLNDKSIFNFDHIVATCKQFGFALAITETACAELIFNSKKAASDAATKQKAVRALKAIEMVKTGEIISVGFSFDEITADGYTPKRLSIDEIIESKTSHLHRSYIKAMDTVKITSFSRAYYGFLNDAIIEDDVVNFANTNRATKVIFISNDAQVGGRGRMAFCEEENKFAVKCTKEYALLSKAILSKLSLLK